MTQRRLRRSLVVKALLLGVVIGTLASLFMRRRRGRTDVVRAPPHRTTDEASEGDPLEQLTRAELYRRAQAAGILGRSGMTKAELVAALRAAAQQGGEPT